MRALYFVIAALIAMSSSCDTSKKKVACTPNADCTSKLQDVDYSDPEKPFYKGEIVLTLPNNSPTLRGNDVTIEFVKGLMSDIEKTLVKDGTIDKNQPLGSSIKRCLCDENIFLIGIDPTLGAETNVTNAGNSRPGLGDEGGGFSPNYVIENTNQEENIPKFTTNKVQPLPRSSPNTSTIPLVAILDSGIDLSVFKESPLAAGLYGKASSPDVCNITDDTSGYNFTVDPPNNSITDNHGHGTAVTLAYKYGLDKIDPSAWSQQRVLPIKVLDECGNGSVYSAACGIAYAKQKGADVINMSFGINFNNRHLEYAVKQISRSAIVCSAGNDTMRLSRSNHFPSGYAYTYTSATAGQNDPNENGLSNAFEVMAINKNFLAAGPDQASYPLATYSNYRNSAFAEIGNDIGPIINQAYASISTTRVDCLMQGTSFAAPMLSATIVSKLFGTTLPTTITKTQIQSDAYQHTVNSTPLGSIDYYTYFNKKAI